MLEVALTTLFVAVAVLAIGQRHRQLVLSAPVETLVVPDDDVADLPCPWCKGQTDEDDNSCPSCGQPFG